MDIGLEVCIVVHKPIICDTPLFPNTYKMYIQNMKALGQKKKNSTQDQRLIRFQFF